MSDETLEAIEQLRREMRAGFAKLGEERGAGERQPGDFETTIYDTVALGTLIDALSKLKAGAEVRFDFVYFAPAGLGSYRGYYDHLALGYGTNKMTVATLLEELRGALAPGKTYGGWKGGDYRMTRDTPVWVDNPGESSGTAIVGLRQKYEGLFVLVTRQVD